MYYSNSKSDLIFSCARLDWDDKGDPFGLNNFFSFNSHNLIITSTAAGWTWLFPAEHISFAFRTIWSGQDGIFMAMLLISSQTSFSLFKANILSGKNKTKKSHFIFVYCSTSKHGCWEKVSTGRGKEPSKWSEFEAGAKLACIYNSTKFTCII